MKTIDFNQDDFALVTEVLDILQTSTKLVESLSAVLGSRFVVSGCALTGSYVGAGTVCVDGEIMTTTGGNSSNYCRVVGDNTTVNVQDGSYKTTERTLVLSSSGDFRWSEVKRLDDLSTVMSRITSVENGKADSSHTHSLSSSVTSSSSSQTANVYGVKKAYDKGVEALNVAEGKSDSSHTHSLSSSVTSTSATQAANVAGVKTAYDKGVAALSAAGSAQATADGKLAKSIDITSGDLNTYKTPGLYHCVGDDIATAISNTPQNNAFSLIVENAAGVIQKLTAYNTNMPRTYRRSYYRTGDRWGPWFEDTMTYTSFAQLGLVDGDFSPADWDANVRVVFNAMAPCSTFKAGLCGGSETPVLNASIIESGSPISTPALEFNKEHHTSAPCVVYAKDNNSAKYAMYNIDDAGSEWVTMETMEHAAITYSNNNKVSAFYWSSGELQLPNTANIFASTNGGIAGDALVRLPTVGGVIKSGSMVSVSWAATEVYGETMIIKPPTGYTFHRGFTETRISMGQAILFVLQGTTYYIINRSSSFSS